MRKLKGAAVLGGLIAVGLLLLSSFPVSGQDSSDFLKKVVRTFQRACAHAADEDMCRVVVRGIQLVLRGADPDRMEKALEKEIGKALHLARNTTCAQCQRAAANFLEEIHLNLTIADIEEALHEGCGARFSDPVAVRQCEAVADQYVPQVIQFIGQVNVTTRDICSSAKFCRAP